VSKAKEVKGSWALAAGRPGTTERKEPGLVWVEVETKTREALSHHLSHPLCIVFTLEGDDKIVRKADQLSFAPQSWNDIALKPRVEHVVQVDVSQ